MAQIETPRITRKINQSGRSDAARCIATAIFGTTASTAFAERFVPEQGRVPPPKQRHFARFLESVRLLWCVYTDETRSEVAGFVLISDLPHHNSIGFGISPRFAQQGLMLRALFEILASDVPEGIEFPLNAYTSARNTAALRLLEKAGFTRQGPTRFGGEPSLHYSRARPS